MTLRRYPPNPGTNISLAGWGGACTSAGNGDRCTLTIQGVVKVVVAYTYFECKKPVAHVYVDSNQGPTCGYDGYVANEVFPKTPPLQPDDSPVFTQPVPAGITGT